MNASELVTTFVNGLGLDWAGLFFVAMVGWLTCFFILLRDLSRAVLVIERHRPGATASDDGLTPLMVWNELQEHKARIEGMQDVVEKGLSFFPVLGLIGTVVGFLKAMFFVGQGHLGSSDSLTLLNGLLANGVAEALATTVVGQVLYALFYLVYTIRSRMLTEVVSAMNDSMSYVLSQLPRFEPGQLAPDEPR